jgi:hypothetical protein
MIYPPPVQDAPVRRWARPGEPASRRILVRAAVAGLVSAFVLSDWLLTGRTGLNILVAVAAVTAATLPACRQRINRTSVAFGLASLGLAAMAVLRDAPWYVALCLLLAVPLASYALTGGRTWIEVLGGGVTLILAIVEMVPWASQGFAVLLSSGRGSARLVARTALVTIGLVVVFGTLLSSADAAFGDLLTRLIPEISLGTTVVRVFLFGMVTCLTLAGTYLATTDPRLKDLTPAPGKPSGPYAWAVPLAALNLLFVAFCAVQATVLLTSDKNRLLRSTGLNYSEYARQGFFQLVCVTVLVIVVLALAVRHAPRSAPVLVRVLLGLLCALALVIVAVAVRRIYLYEEASGWTRLRLWVHAFELWLGVVIVLIAVAGIRLKASWLPRAVAGTGAAGLLMIGLINPDGFIASHNVDRHAQGRHFPVSYLAVLSADAVPALDRLPEPQRSCALRTIAADLADAESWTSFNYARHRARDILAKHPIGACP